MPDVLAPLPNPSQYLLDSSAYRAPQVDFSWLGNIPQQQQEMQLNALKAQLMRADLAQRGYQLRAYQDYYGGSGADTSATDTPAVGAAPTSGRSAEATARDPRGKIPVIIAAAQKYGIDPAVAIRVARSEGLNQFTSGIRGENSFGAFQLNTQGGMGNDFQRDTGLDPRDQKNEDATIDYALRRAAKEGWGAFHGAANTGIGRWAGIGGRPQQQQAAQPTNIALNATGKGYGPDGTSTAAPAPTEPVAGSLPSGPPFAPNTATGSANSKTVSGPQNIRLASTSPSMGAQPPQPPTAVTPTSPAEVAGTQGGGATAPTATGYGGRPAAPVTPAGRDNLPQGQGAETTTRTAQLAEPESDPQIRQYDAQINALQKRIDKLTPVAFPQSPMRDELENRQKQQQQLLEQRRQRYDMLSGERKMQLETGEAKTRAEQAAKIQTGAKEEQDTLQYLRDTSQEGIEATGRIGQLDAIADLARKAPYGAMTTLKQRLGEWGIETQGLSDIQAYQDAINFLAPSLRPPGSGPLRSNEITGFKAALGGLLTTPEGRIIAVNNLKLMSQYKQAVGAIARDDSKSPPQRMREIAAVPFPKLQTSLPGQEAGAAPARPTSEAEYRALPSGTHYIAPDGKEKVKR